MGYIYKVTNTVNGRMYIGQTRCSIKSRWRQHKGKHKNKNQRYRCLLYDAMKKYGVESFIIEEVEQCDDELLNEREMFWIKEYDTVKNGYNISHGGQGYLHDAVPVVQFDLDGNYVRTFASAREAAEHMNVRPQAIYSVCDGHAGSWGRYQWRYLPDAEKQGMKLGKLKRPPKRVPVHQYDLDGNYIASYVSMSSAVSQFGGRGTGGIRRVCEGDIRWSYGYRWSYDKVDKLPPMRTDRSNRPVAKMDDAFNIIKVYPKTIVAAIEHNVTQWAIASVCRGVHEKCAGFRWKYYDGQEEVV